MLRFDSLENVPVNQRIDLPFIVYQSKPKAEKDRFFKSSTKYGILIPCIALGLQALWFALNAIVKKKFGLLVIAFLPAFLALIIFVFYLAMVKQTKELNRLATLDLPEYYPFIHLTKDRLIIYDRENQNKFDLAINELKSIEIERFKAIYNLNFYFKNFQQNTKEYIVNLHDIDFYVNFSNKNYYISGGGIVYFVEFIRYMQTKNPNLDHVILNKSHFINGYPVNDKWL